jgi:hypothetical protein
VAATLIFISLASIPFCMFLAAGIIEWTMAVSIGAFVYFFTVFVVFQLLYNKGKRLHEEKIKKTAP